MTDPSGSSAGGPVRTVALGAVAFAATLILLFGFATLVLQSRDGGPVSASSPPSAPPSTTAPTPTPTASATPSVVASDGTLSSIPGLPSPSASADPIFVGVGDIADCTLEDDSATATLIEELGDSGTAPCH